MRINRKLCISVLIIILLVFVFRYYNSLNTPISVISLSTTLAIVFSCVFLFFFCKEKNRLLDGNFLNIGSIFVLGYVIVHFFNYLAYVLSEIDVLSGYGFYRNNIVNEAAINSSCALIAFMIGYICTQKPFKCKRQRNYYVDVDVKLDYLALLFFVIFFVTMDKSYFLGGYGEAMHARTISPVTSVSQNLLISSLIGSSCIKAFRYNSLALKDYFISYSKLFYFVFGTYFVLVMMSGDRGPLIQLAMCFFSVYFIINKKKLTFLKFVIPLFWGVLALFFLGKFRAAEGNFKDKIANTGELIDDEFGRRSVVFAATYELSGVARSYHVLYDYTDRNGTFYGFAFFDQMLGFIPGLRPFVVYPLLGIDNPDKFNTSKIATKELQRDDAGMGTTCCADVYINFGFWGTIIVFMIFGNLFKKLDLELYGSRYNLFVFVFAINYLILAVYMGRAKFSSPLTFSMYTFFLLYIASAMKKKSNKSIL